MRNGTLTTAGLMADAGAARPRAGMSGVNVCTWSIGMNGSKPAYQVFADITTHLTRRLQESSP